MSLSQDKLKQLLHYNSETGAFTWLCGRREGHIAGCLRGDGYRQITIQKMLFLEHRLAYLYMTGEWPIHQIDHKGLRRDNSWNMIRPATHSQNKMNTPIQLNNTTGYKGVTFDYRRRKYAANIKKDKRNIFLGYFEEASEAYEAYIIAAKELHGEFTRLS